MTTFILAHETARRRAMAAVAEAPEGFVVKVEPAKRSLPQNDMLHGILAHISKTAEWAGKRRSIDVWKRLLVASWMREEGHSVEVLPALDGHGIDVVYAPTSSLSKEDCASLLDFVQAWAIEQGIDLDSYYGSREGATA